MKASNQILLFLVCICVITSCSFSKGSKTLPLLGLSYSYNGLSVDDIKLYDTNENSPLKNKKIKIGRTLLIYIEDLTGFMVEDDKIFPACEITVTDPDGNIMLHSDDLYTDQSGYDANMNNFSLTVGMGSPIVGGKDYKTVAHFYDKKNPKNKLDITVKSEVIE